MSTPDLTAGVSLPRDRALRRIERLRLQHTANAQAGRWQANDTVNRKIIEAWAAYHRLAAKGNQ